MGMKQILLMMAAVVLVGCGSTKVEPPQASEAEPQVVSKPTPVSPADEKLIADPIVEQVIRRRLKKPEGELTEADLENVTALELYDTRITDADLKDLAKLQKLDRLWLFGTQITDVGLKDVAKLQKLTHLDLRRTKITDEGLKEVAKWQQLERLSLEITQVTEAGVGKLQTALPNCEITGP